MFDNVKIAAKFHIALGLNHNAPSYIVGFGYSYRFDDLFAQLMR